MYCPHCGENNLAGATVCMKCQNRLPSENPPQAVQPASQGHRSSFRCPHCNSNNVSYQAVQEGKPMDLGTVIIYITLALTCLGLLIVIPLMLTKKTVTVSYAVCQNCGYRWRYN